MTETEKLLLIEKKLDEIITRLNQRVMLACPHCNRSVEHKQLIRLVRETTTIWCPDCDKYFEAKVVPI